MPKVFIKRGTRSQINAAAGSAGLNAGELYLITDEGKLAVGTSASAYIEVQAQDGDIDAIAALSGTSGLLKKTAANTWTLDTTTYLTSAAIGSSVQAYDADLDTWATKTAPSGTVVGTTDTQTLTNKTLTAPKDTIYAITDGASVDINPANGGIQTWTLGANRTPTASSFAAGQSMTLMIDDGTAYAVTWTTIGVTWISGSAPVLATSGYTVIVLWKVGSTIYGAY